MDCARVVRGISSTANALAPVAAISCKDFLRAQRAQEADEKLVAAQQRDVGFAGAVVRTVAENLGDDVRLRKDGGAIGSDLCALLGVGGVRIPGFDSRALFDEYFHSSLGEVRNHQRHQRDAPLARETLFWNANNHKPSPVYSILLRSSPPGEERHGATHASRGESFRAEGGGRSDVCNARRIEGATCRKRYKII